MDHQIAPPQTRKAKGNSPHPKRGSRRPIRPTSKRAYYCTFIEPTPKIREKWSSRHTLDKMMRGPGFEPLQSGAGRPGKLAPLNSFSPHSSRISHTNVQFSSRQKSGGANWFLTRGIIRTGRIQSNQKNQSSYSRFPLQFGVANQPPRQITL